MGARLAILEAFPWNARNVNFAFALGTHQACSLVPSAAVIQTSSGPKRAWMPVAFEASWIVGEEDHATLKEAKED